MSYFEVYESVKKLKEKYMEADPFKLCSELGIVLQPMRFGTAPTAIKGFFVEKRRIKCIAYNSDLPEVIQRIIVAHELGHSILHAKQGINAFHDIGLYDETSITEKDANLFAGELLLDDDEVYEALNADTTFFGAAKRLCVPPELLDFKFRVMKWRGFRFCESPITAKSNFMLNMEVPENHDFDAS